MNEVFGFDCDAPTEIAEHVENVGVMKANLPLLSMAALGVLAGGFIGLAALVAWSGHAKLADGAAMLGLVYWVIYRRGTEAQSSPSDIASK